MAIQIRGRGYPLLMEVVNDSVVKFNLNAGTNMAVTSAGVISATDFSGTNAKVTTVTATTVQGTTVQGTTLCGATAASAMNMAMTYAGGSSACLCGGSGTISADRFLKATINSKTYYIPCYASAGALSAA